MVFLVRGSEGTVRVDVSDGSTISQVKQKVQTEVVFIFFRHFSRFCSVECRQNGAL